MSSQTLFLELVPLRNLTWGKLSSLLAVQCSTRRENAHRHMHVRPLPHPQLLHTQYIFNLKDVPRVLVYAVVLFFLLYAEARHWGKSKEPTVEPLTNDHQKTTRNRKKV